MTDKNKSQDPFDQFEELPAEGGVYEDKEVKDSNSEVLDSLNTCLQIVYNALSGNIVPIIRLGNTERNELLVYLDGVLKSKDIVTEVEDWNAQAKSPASPSQEEASRVVQSPEEAQKEQEFLDTLGI